jgi:outer membrane protein TolC
MRKKIFYLLIFAAGLLNAQSVDSLIREAELNNPQLKALQQRIKSAEYKSESAKYLPPPSVGVEFQQIPFKNPDPVKSALSQNLVFSQMFMVGGKLGAMYDAERQNVNIAQSSLAEEKNKILASVRTQYYKIWMDEHHIDLREDMQVLLNNLLNSAENSYKINRTRYSDLLLIRSEIASNETDLINLQNDLKSETYKMNYLLGRDLADSSLDVQHNWKIDSLSTTEEGLVNDLLRQNPSLKKMDQMIRMDELEKTANNKELIPDIMVQGMVMRMPQGMLLTTKTDPMMRMAMGETEYMYSIMASVTLPFMPWSVGKYNSRDQELAAGISGLSYEKINMQREMISELKSTLKKIESKRSQVNLYEVNVIPLYKQTLDAQLKDYSNNQLPVSSVLDTYRTLLLKEEDLAEIKMEHQMLMADIYMMLGNGDYHENQ